MNDAIADLCAFLDASPSPFHACVAAAARLEAAGFKPVEEDTAWPAGPGARYLVRDGTLLAWAVPDGAAPGTPFRIVGAHTDSPNLRVKPEPDRGRAGARQLGLEVYGGVLLNSWLDRDLGLSGRVAVRDASAPGGASLRLLKIDEPLLRIPQLAIHLDREIVTDGLHLNPQQHLDPIWAVGDGDPGGFRRYLAAALDVAPRDILSWDLMVHDIAPATVLGRDGELLSSARLDNLCSAWAAVAAVEKAATAPEQLAIPVICLFDHEEIGSSTHRGAASPILATTLERVSVALGGEREEWLRALAGSVCASADMAHATHPNYPDRHEPGHWIALNGGPVVKTNANQRYATDARSAAAFLLACDRASVPVQQYVHRNDLPCGSTIGPITATRLGIPTVDIGAPMLAMHSARELMGSADPAMYAQALTAFLA